MRAMPSRQNVEGSGVGAEKPKPELRLKGSEPDIETKPCPTRLNWRQVGKLDGNPGRTQSVPGTGDKKTGPVAVKGTGREPLNGGDGIVKIKDPPHPRMAPGPMQGGKPSRIICGGFKPGIEFGSPGRLIPKLEPPV